MAHFLASDQSCYSIPEPIKKWTVFSGISGRHPPESVDGLLRNSWSISPGLCTIILPWGKIEQAISTIFSNAQKTERDSVGILFHGTGESLVKWPYLVKTVKYAINYKPANLQLNFSLVTNGTLIDEEKAKFLSEYNFSLTLSMDGLEDSQNSLRPYKNGRGSFCPG